MLTIDEKEIYRYLGYKGGNLPDEAVLSRLAFCRKELEQAISPKSVVKSYPLRVEDKTTYVEELPMESAALARHLEGCSRVYVFAATLGIGPDRLIARAQVAKMSDAVMYQALSAAMIEAYCDAVCEGIQEEAEKDGLRLRPRFSPGYGDCSISYQKDVLQILEAGKAIGLTLTDAFLMMPSKSVTAFVGAGPAGDETPREKEERCALCDFLECSYRSGPYRGTSKEE